MLILLQSLWSGKHEWDIYMLHVVVIISVCQSEMGINISKRAKVKLELPLFIQYPANICNYTNN